MKIEIEVKDKEEFINALNNAIVALNEFHCEIYFMVDTKNLNFGKIIDKYGKDKCVEVLRNRLTILHDVYDQIQNTDN